MVLPHQRTLHAVEDPPALFLGACKSCLMYLSQLAATMVIRTIIGARITKVSDSLVINMELHTGMVNLGNNRQPKLQCISRELHSKARTLEPVHTNPFPRSDTHLIRAMPDHQRSQSRAWYLDSLLRNRSSSPTTWLAQSLGKAVPRSTKSGSSAAVLLRSTSLKTTATNDLSRLLVLPSAIKWHCTCYILDSVSGHEALERTSCD